MSISSVAGADRAKRHAVVVLGMHRSGTSAVAGVLHLLGVDFGSNLLPAVKGINQKGFWEHRDIVPIHDRLLADLGHSWDDPRPLPEGWWKLGPAAACRRSLLEVLNRDLSGARIFGVKDPRLCKILPLWLDLLEEFDCAPGFILVFRGPEEIAASLRKREGLPADKCAVLYLRHMLEAERWTRPCPRAFVGYDRLLADPVAVFRNVADKLKVDWPIAPDAAHKNIRRFLDPAMRHHGGVGASDGSKHWSQPLAASLHQRLSDQCDGENAGAGGPFDEIRAELESVVSRLDPVFIGHVGDLNERLNVISAHYDRLRNSRMELIKQFIRLCLEKIR
jgi:hypothetical protein